MIRAVIFDMDGLMYDTEQMTEECWKRAARHTRIAMTPQTLSALRCRASADREAYLKSIFGDRIDYRRLERQMYKELHTRIGEKGLPLKSGLWELLVYLRRNGYRLAVQTTNTAQTAAWYLALSGCSEFFETVVTAENIQGQKSDKQAYDTVLERLSLPAKDCLVLDDSPAGIVGAHRAGCPAVMIPDLDEPAPGIETVGTVVADLEQVVPYLQTHEGLPEQPWTPIKNVVFDLGGVVVDFDPRGYLRRRFADRPLEAYLYQSVFASEMWKQLDAGILQRDEVNKRLLEQATADGVRFEMQTVLDEWQDELRTRRDTVALIRQLKKSGARVYYLSNIAKDTWQMLEDRGLLKEFDGGVASWEVGLNKPDPAIFKLLLKRYKLVPTATIFFDDTLENAESARTLSIVGLHFHSAALAEKNLEGYQVL